VVPCPRGGFYSAGTASGKHFRRLRACGYAAWSLGPKYPDFIDGRGNNPDLSMEQFQPLQRRPRFPGMADRGRALESECSAWLRRPTFVACETWMRTSFCQSASWRPVYMDDVSLVFLRNTPGNSSLIRRLQIDCSTQALAPPASASRSALHDFYLNSGELFFILHRDGDAEESLGRGDALDRGDPNVHLLKGLLFERRSNTRKPSRSCVHRSRSTKRRSLALSRFCFGSEGRNAAALDALEHAAGWRFSLSIST